MGKSCIFGWINLSRATLNCGNTQLLTFLRYYSFCLINTRPTDNDIINRRDKFFLLLLQLSYLLQHCLLFSHSIRENIFLKFCFLQADRSESSKNKHIWCCLQLSFNMIQINNKYKKAFIWFRINLIYKFCLIFY